jgi:hypothetical protein
MNTHDLVSNLVVGSGASDAYHDASEVGPDESRTRHRATTQPEPGEDVELAERCSANLHHDLPRIQFGLGDLFEFEAGEPFPTRVDGTKVSDAGEIRHVRTDILRYLRLDEARYIDLRSAHGVLTLFG